jgi:phospholipid/cholesterol/gamma-HCH transport system substrate-binding protein
MNESRLATKVGLFVALGLVLLVLLLMSFSKGLTILTRSYELNLRAVSVGGLKDRAAVLMSGVTIGNVVEATIPPDGHGVVIKLKIQEQFKIHGDARFRIDQIGFLGDQYIAIYPTKNEKPVLQPGAEVQCDAPLDFQDIIRSFSGLVTPLHQTIKTLEDMLTRVDRTLLAEENLTNLTAAVRNVRLASEKASAMVDHINALVDTNSRPISSTMTNLVSFSEQMKGLAEEMSAAVATNKIELSAALRSINSISKVLEQMVNDVESGRGLAGALMRDDTLRVDVREMIAYLQNFSSNLYYGGIFNSKAKPPKREKESGPSRGGRSPFNK